jgi:hypothetical protein
MPRPRLLLVLSDLHSGSRYAVVRPGTMTSSGSLVGLTPAQEWLWPAWDDVWARADDYIDGDPFALACNGDMIEGKHHGGRELWSDDVADHVRAAVDLLEPIAKRATSVVVTMGTECHVEMSEIGIGAALGALVHPQTRQPAGNRWDVRIAGCPVAIKHHMGTSTRPWTGATQLSVQQSLEQLTAARSGAPIPRAICLAHRHQPDVLTNRHGVVVVTAPWQVLTRYGHKVVGHERPAVGLAVLDWRDRDDGDAPHVQEIVVEMPLDPLVEL